MSESTVVLQSLAFGLPLGLLGMALGEALDRLMGRL